MGLNFNFSSCCSQKEKKMKYLPKFYWVSHSLSIGTTRVWTSVTAFWGGRNQNDLWRQGVSTGRKDVIECFLAWDPLVLNKRPLRIGCCWHGPFLLAARREREVTWSRFILYNNFLFLLRKQHTPPPPTGNGNVIFGPLPFPFYALLL